HRLHPRQYRQTGSGQTEASALGVHPAATEREYISLRTKQGLAAARAKGKQLGRPKGSRNKERVLDPYRKQIREYLQRGLTPAAVRKLINSRLAQPLSYHPYKYFVQQEPDRRALWQAD